MTMYTWQCCNGYTSVVTQERALRLKKAGESISPNPNCPEGRHWRIVSDDTTLVIVRSGKNVQLNVTFKLIVRPDHYSVGIIRAIDARMRDWSGYLSPAEKIRAIKQGIESSHHTQPYRKDLQEINLLNILV